MRESTGDRDFDGEVLSGQTVDRPVGKQLGGVHVTTKNLKEDRDVGRNKRNILKVKGAILIQRPSNARNDYLR